MAEKYVMVSLGDDKAKEIAEVISNKTCRKILDHLSEKSATETEIAKELGIPLSTTHYNLQLLKKSNLIEPKDFYWSGKGKKVDIYKVAKKMIIITSKGAEKLRSNLRKVLPVALVCALAAGAVHFFSKNIARKFNMLSSGAMDKAVEGAKAMGAAEAAESTFAGAAGQIGKLMEGATTAGAEAAEEAATGVATVGEAAVEEAAVGLAEVGEGAKDAVMNVTPEITSAINASKETIQTIISNAVSNYAIWFLAGALFALTIYLILNRRRK